MNQKNLELDNNIFYRLLFLFVFIFSSECYSQEIDSLSKYEFSELASKFYKSENNSLKAFAYASSYLEKAKKNTDSTKIADGFYFLSYLVSNLSNKKKEEDYIAYNDSIIKYTKNLKKNDFYPSYAYYGKGNYYYTKRQYFNSIDNYLSAFYSVHNNEYLKNSLKYSIGLLKIRYGENNEALKLFKEVSQFYESKKETNNESYLMVLFALGDVHLRNKNIDSSYFYYDLGYRKSEKIKSQDWKPYFVLGKGIIEFSKLKYISAIDSISKSYKKLIEYKDLPNLTIADYFIGKSYDNLNKPKKAVLHFKKVDSLFNIINDLHPDLRDNYVYLINYYKSKNNTIAQLKYINQLLRLDSILNTNYKIINKKFYKEYETTKLINEKENLQVKLNKKAYLLEMIEYFVVFLIIFLSFIFRLIFKRNRKYKRIYNELIKDTKVVVKSNIKKDGKTGIPKGIEREILQKLVEFEKNNEFLKRDIKLYDLAKSMSTNSKYLSTVINFHKEKNFSNYLNDLRIEFIIKKLKTDNVLKKYTIEAIAKEIGFNSAESFSKTFYRGTGIYPSYYIKKLNEEQ